MKRPPATKADLMQAWSGVATVILLLCVSIGGLIRFSRIDKGLADLQAEKTQVEIEAATKPILAVEPTLFVGPGLGNQFCAAKLQVRAKNVGNGTLRLGTVSVQVSQCNLPDSLARELTTAWKRGYDDKYQSTLDRTKIVPISRYDLKWTPVVGTTRRYRIESSLLSTQDAQFYVDYVLEPSVKPHLIRFEVTLAPPKGGLWQSRTCDLVAPFGPLPAGFGEARKAGRERQVAYTVSGPTSTTAEDSVLRNDQPIRDTLRLVPIE